MKKSILIISGLLFLQGCSILPGTDKQKPTLVPTSMFNSDVVFQVSNIKQLFSGNYNPIITLGELKKKGNFGIGTLEGIDGEMVFVDSRIYQVTHTGTVNQIYDNKIFTPFATTNFFRQDEVLDLNTQLDCNTLKQQIEKSITDKNLIHAIWINGNFEKIQTRSVKKQQKPYPPLSQVIKEQNIFNFENTSGDIVGYYIPDYLSGINSAGFHFHFVSTNRKQGGHLLDCTSKNVKIYIDRIKEYHLLLPKTEQ